jgi:hypothetical protein
MSVAKRFAMADRMHSACPARACRTIRCFITKYSAADIRRLSACIVDLTVRACGARSATALLYDGASIT